MCCLGVETKQPIEAFKWLYIAAKQGHEDAQYELGKRYLTGSGTPMGVEDLLKAVFWLEKAKGKVRYFRHFCFFEPIFRESYAFFSF